MKFVLKMIKAWKNGDATHDVGTVIEIEEKAVRDMLIADGYAVAHKADDSDIDARVRKGVEDGLKQFRKAQEERELATVKDLEMQDPTCGYGPQIQSGRARTIEEKHATLSAFALDVYKACAPSPEVSPRLRKMQSMRKERIQKAFELGLVDKAALSGAEVGTGQNGGYLLPQESSTMLIEQASHQAVIRPMATIIPMGTQSLDLPQFMDYSHANNQVFGGVITSWGSENSQLSATRSKMENVSLKLNRVNGLAAASHEMMRFSPISVGGYILPMLSTAVAKAEDYAFIAGDGVGKPLGVIAAPGTLTIAIEAGQTLANGIVVTKNIKKMFERFMEGGRPESMKWLYQKLDLFTALTSLKEEVGTGGVPQSLISSITDPAIMRLFGLPLQNTEFCSAGGTPGDIILGDWSTYFVADDRSGIELAQSAELLFDYAQQAFRAIKYVGGQPRYKQVFTRLNSTNTASPFVVLAART